MKKLRLSFPKATQLQNTAVLPKQVFLVTSIKLNLQS